MKPRLATNSLWNQAELELFLFLLRLPKCWDYWWAPPRLPLALRGFKLALHTLTPQRAAQNYYQNGQHIVSFQNL